MKTKTEMEEQYKKRFDQSQSWERKLRQDYPGIWGESERDCDVYCPQGWQHIVENVCACFYGHLKYTTLEPEKKTLKERAYKFVWCWFLYKPCAKLFVYLKPADIWKKEGVRPFLDCDATKIAMDEWKATRTGALVTRLTTWIRSKRPQTRYKKVNVCTNVTIHQIKEKFGTLRIYFDADSTKPDHLDGIVDLAESLSGTTCETSGRPGRLCRKGWWYKTLCEEERLERGYVVAGKDASDKDLTVTEGVDKSPIEPDLTLTENATS